MSTPFTDPYSETASFLDLVQEIALASYQRNQVIYGPDWDTLQDNRDVQFSYYWSNRQFAFINNPLRTFWVDYKNYTPGTWPPPIYTTQEQVWTAAGLHPQGFRRATSWDGVTEPEWQYGTMQEGDIIGPWIIEDLQKMLSALRWAYWPGNDVSISGSNLIHTINKAYQGMSEQRLSWAAAHAEAENNYSLISTGDQVKEILRYTSEWEYADAPTTYEAYLSSSEVTINFNVSGDLIDCPREIILYANVSAWGTFDGFGDYAAPGYYLKTVYPSASGPVLPIVFGTPNKPSPWHSVSGIFGYRARPQMLIKWDFTNCNEV